MLSARTQTTGNKVEAESLEDYDTNVRDAVSLTAKLVSANVGAECVVGCALGVSVSDFKD